MDGLPFFKFFAAEYLSDEDVLAMSFAERGLFQTLLARCWVEGSIPADLGRLARLLGVDADALRPLYEGIASRFEPHPADPCRRISPRLEKERSEAMERAEQKSEAGRAAAKARWRHKNPGDANALRPQYDRNASKSQSQSQRKSQTQTPARAGARDGGGPTEEALLGFRVALASQLGVPHIGLGKDGARAVASVQRWLDAGVPQHELLLECARLAREKGVTPAHLSWWPGWLDTVSDDDLARVARGLQVEGSR